MLSMKTYKKKDLVESIYSKTSGMSKNQVKSVVDYFIDEVKSVLVTDESNRIELRGFGVFESKLRKAKIARNPRTNEEIRVKERYQPVFKAGKDLKEKVASLEIKN